MRRVLFVGAPFGSFTRFVAPALEQRGVSVWRIVADGGEYVATPPKNRIVYRNRDAQCFDAGHWAAFLDKVIIDRRISAVITFNDSCRRSKVAHAVAARLRVPRFVLEEGYLRPWWVTFDHEGVNGYSLLPKDPQFYLDQDLTTPPHEVFSQSFRYLARDILTHYAACIALSPVLPYDKRYYGDSIWTQAKGYTREYVWRKTHDERPVLDRLRTMRAARARIFVALMQKPGDSQLRVHSPFSANNPYLDQVIGSFARQASTDSILVVKQHPLDYGIEQSEAHFERLVAEHDLQGRAFYLRKLTIESLLELSAGLVTINSTGGLAAVERSVPTIALGTAIYDMPGLTFQHGLDRFWTEGMAPDPRVVTAFVNYLKAKTQINGGFYTHRQLALLTENIVEKLAMGYTAPHAAIERSRPIVADEQILLPVVA